jgi:hypothetical protein
MSSPTEKRETMTSAEHCALAQRLNDATRDGRLVDAYRVLSELEPGDAELVALRAGFSVITKKTGGSSSSTFSSSLLTLHRRA